MDFAFDSSQDQLREAARRLLSASATIPGDGRATSPGRGFDTALWAAIAGLGWTGWILPPEFGGGGGRFLDLVVLHEEFGRAAVGGPFLTSATLAGSIIMAAGPDAARQRYLPGIASGEALGTLAVAEPGSRMDGDVIGCTAVQAAAGRWRVDGRKTFVSFADAATWIVVAARTSGDPTDRDGLTLIVIDPTAPGVSVEPVAGLDDERPSDVILDGVGVRDADVLGTPGAARGPLDRALERATVALAAEMLGGSEAVLELAIDRARSRKQRGRVLGRHQAIQHRIADVAVAIEVGRVLVHQAAWLLDRGEPAPLSVAMAKAAIGDAYHDATWLAALVLGGAGFMADHPLGRHYRRAKAAEFRLGDAEAHRDVVARLLLESGPTSDELSKASTHIGSVGRREG